MSSPNGHHSPRHPVNTLRIGVIAPPFVAIPPTAYAGTERVIAALVLGLHERGHRVTLFGSGDSRVPCELVPVVPESIWEGGPTDDIGAYMSMAVTRAWDVADRFDIIHSHVEAYGFDMARSCPTPVLTTFHRRVDTGGVADLIDLRPDVPLIAISDSQRRWNPDANWLATIHHGLDFSATPTSTATGAYLLLVGRLSPEKGVTEAIEVARRTGYRLVMAAKSFEPDERVMYETVVQPAVDAGIVDWRGEIGTSERDELMAGALATLMLGAWPEPFGLVAIESMATGTPVIARRAGGCTETVVHGETGYLVDDVEEAVLAVSRLDRLSRSRISTYARARFSADRMIDDYEAAFRRLIAQRHAAAPMNGEEPEDGDGARLGPLAPNARRLRMMTLANQVAEPRELALAATRAASGR